MNPVIKLYAALSKMYHDCSWIITIPGNMHNSLLPEGVTKYGSS